MPSSNSPDHIAVHNRHEPRSKKPKRFQCTLCQKVFGRLEHLQRHERTHTQERPFVCGQCESRFTRSDLLTRHNRLSHNRSKGRPQPKPTSDHLSDIDHSTSSQGSTKRQRGNEVRPIDTIPSGPGSQNGSMNSPHVNFQPSTLLESAIGQLQPGHGYQSPLTALSLAAEQSALQDAAISSTAQNHSIPNEMPTESFGHRVSQSEAMCPSMSIGDTRLPADHGGLDECFDTFVDFLEAGPLSSYHFTSLVTTEQPMPFFSPDSFADFDKTHDDTNDQDHTNSGHGQDMLLEDLNSFSRFGSRLPSLQPEEDTPDPQNAAPNHINLEIHRRPTHPKRVYDVSYEDRQFMAYVISEFVTLPPDFKLPTRISLARYIRAYVDGFQEHLPFLHIPSMSVKGCSVELILAMAAVGAQYCFEAEQGVELFQAARAIATERIRRRDARIALAQRDQGRDESVSSRYLGSSPAGPNLNGSMQSHTINGPLGLPSGPESLNTSFPPKEDLMQSAQALLILMAMATWAKHKEILREALAIQSILATLVRDDGLQLKPSLESAETWDEWCRYESILRTKYIVFCFFNLHCIVYDIPPLILNSELKMRLPCSATEFKADTEAAWQEARARASEPLQFQDALRQLFSGGGKDMTKWHSSLGNYVLIHAIIQHIFFVRQIARTRIDSSELTAEDITPLDQALRNWQSGWKSNPESSLDPMDPNGPVAFNSTALLRLAYIRLNMDSGPGRALGTRDPFQIAYALRDTPTIKRTPKLLRALLHSAHALSIPIKIGIRLVAKTQTFVWSIQHSLCSLECALLLSKWLEAVSVSGPNPEPPITENEKRIMLMVKTVLDETEFGVPPERVLDPPEMAKYLNVGVLRVWATIFTGAQTWAIVDVIGSSLNIYADMLEAT